MYCNVPGCHATAGRYGRLCPKHVARKRSQGHPEQEPIGRFELRPWCRAVRPVIDRNRHREALKITEERWQNLRDRCALLADGSDKGGIVYWPTTQAARALLKATEDAKFDAVLETVSAMVLLRDTNPGRFKSDEAFSVQLARVVRRLGTTAVAWGWDRKTGKTRGVYRVFPRLASLELADMVLDAVGPTVGRIVATVKAEAELEARREGHYRAALAEIV